MRGKDPGGMEPLPIANDNENNELGGVTVSVDRHILCIAQALGRYIVREQMKEWRRRQHHAANDNHRCPPDN